MYIRNIFQIFCHRLNWEKSNAKTQTQKHVQQSRKTQKQSADFDNDKHLFERKSDVLVDFIFILCTDVRKIQIKKKMK